MSMTHAEPTWGLRRAIEDALPEAFAEESRALLALDIGAAVAAHLLAELAGVDHAAHSCSCSHCSRECRAQHEATCSCPVARVRDLLRVPPE